MRADSGQRRCQHLGGLGGGDDGRPSWMPWIGVDWSQVTRHWAFAAALSQQRLPCSTQQLRQSVAWGQRPAWLEQHRRGARPGCAHPAPRPVVRGAPVRGRWSCAVLGSPEWRVRRFLRSDASDARVAQHRPIRDFRRAAIGDLASLPAHDFRKLVLRSPHATVHCHWDRGLGCREPAVHGPLEAALHDSTR